MLEGMDFVNNFAQWQPDENMKNCLNCNTAFSFLVRKHHCRCCGGLFCGSCADNFARYDSNRVRTIKRFDCEEEYPPFRTCACCYDNLLHMRLLLSPWGKRLEATEPPRVRRDRISHASRGGDSRTNEGSTMPLYPPGEIIKNSTVVMENSLQSTTGDIRRSDVDEENSCPICNMFLGDFGDNTKAEEHVEECIRKAEITQQRRGLQDGVDDCPTFQNRMLVYKIVPPREDHAQFSECPICFEEMVPGDKVGRLECLCIFHYKCIKSWFHKKARKMKSNNIKYIGKNFCPLHDAV